jgi:uncharacterized iron-regulated membrane protein
MATPILFLATLALLTLTTTPLLFLFWLMQPATRVNPGVSAYIPPSGARLEPMAHTVGSRDPPTELSSATNFAQGFTRSELIEDAQMQQIKVSPKHEVRPANLKQSRVGYRRKYEQSARAYAQQWNNHWQPFYR